MSDGVVIDSEVNGDKVKIKLLPENLDIERKCDTEYHLAYTELLARGIMPRATLEKRMAEKEIWSPADEKKLGELQTSLARLQIDLEGAETHEKGLAVATEMGNLRAECLRLVEVKAAVLSNSCESLADQIRRDAYIAYATVFADTEKPVFKDYNDFLARAKEKVVLDAREAMLKIATETFNTSLTGLPEVNYVRNVEKKIQEDKEEETSTATATATRKKTAKKTAKKVTKKVTKKRAPKKE